MILSTTPQIEGHTIRECKAPIKREKSDARIGSSERKEARPKVKGIVTGETIIGANGSMLMVATSGTAVVI